MKFRLNKSVLPFAITVAVCAILYLLAGLRFPAFFGFGVFGNFFTDNAVLGIAAIGLTFVILSGEIDLSVGSMIAFTSMLIARLVMNHNWHPMAAVALALAFGLGFGAFMGTLVSLFKIPGFLVTLGGLFFARGLSYVLRLESIAIDHPFFSSAAEWHVPLIPGKLDLPLSACIFIAVFLLAMVLAHYTPFGRNVYALGGNEQSAALMGLPTGATRIGVFAVSGFCSALAGVVYCVYTFSGNPNAATGLELDAIAAVVIGGTLLTGGVGYIAGTLVGVLIFGIIQTAITFDGRLSSWWTKIVIGALLLVFLLLQKLIQTKAVR
jgi:ribose/xylose/arabinose/galactoside ABC-type transport system permease subunit